MLVHPQYPLNEIAKVFVGIPRYGKLVRKHDSTKAVKIIGMKAIRDFHIALEAVEEIQVSANVDLDKYRVASNDLLIPCRGTEFRVAIASKEITGMLIDSNILVIRSEPALLVSILAAYLRSPQGMSVLERASQSTTTQKNLTVRAVKTIEISVPEKSIQRQLAELLESAQQQYELAQTIAQKRLNIAQQITLNKLFMEA